MTPSNTRACAEETSDAMTLDFGMYLACRLGMAGPTAIHALGKWLTEYEPAERSRGGQPSLRRCRSGIFSTPDKLEIGPTETTNVA